MSQKNEWAVCLHLAAFGCEQCKAVLRQYDDLLREVFDAAGGDWQAWVQDPQRSGEWFTKVEKLFHD